MKRSSKDPSSLLIGYLTLRKWVGVLGMSLPFVLAVGGLIIFKSGIQVSMSSYYHTGMRDVFVGALWAIGVFLLSYRGYERQDDIAGNLACYFAVGVALFPTSLRDDVVTLSVVGALHLAFAALFFLTLAFFSLFLFTKTDPKKTPTRRKLQRNRVYRVCGYVMVAAIALIVAQSVLPVGTRRVLSTYNPVFWLESVAVVAFGVSWLTKGEAILRDGT